MIHLLVARDVTSRTSTRDRPLVRNGKAPYWTRVAEVAFAGLRINTLAQVTKLPWLWWIAREIKRFDRKATVECFRHNGVNVGCFQRCSLFCCCRRYGELMRVAYL